MRGDANARARVRDRGCATSRNMRRGHAACIEEFPGALNDNEGTFSMTASVPRSPSVSRMLARALIAFGGLLPVLCAVAPRLASAQNVSPATVVDTSQSMAVK